MGEFFSGWRRKIGVVTLALALVASGGWARSVNQFESLGRFYRRSLLQAESYEQTIVLSISHFDRTFPPSWTGNSDTFTNHLEAVNCSILVDLEPSSGEGCFSFPCTSEVSRWGEFVAGTIQGQGHSYRCNFLVIHYWSVVVPLTLLSAFLLLSKQRVARPA